MQKGDFIGKQIGNYRLSALIGSGSFSNVYRGKNIYLERDVAIKLLLERRLNSSSEREQFLREAQLLARLQHPHILPIYDAGIYEDMPYFVTEYALHGSLRDRLKRNQLSPLPLDEALTVLSQVGQALQFAHEQDIVHRDVKPENILFNARDEAFLADFGIATMLPSSSTMSGPIIGTPIYMSPEQFQGYISAKSDQYSLGCVAYELFTGNRPFTGSDMFVIGFRHLSEAPRSLTEFNPNLPLHIERAVLKALAKDRNDRYDTVAYFIQALRDPAVPSVPLLSNPTAPVIPWSQNSEKSISVPSSSTEPSEWTIPDRSNAPTSWQIPPTPPKEPPPNTLLYPDRCPSCGSRLRAEDIFCPNCGLANPLYGPSPLDATVSRFMPSFPVLSPTIVSDESVLAPEVASLEEEQLPIAPPVILIPESSWSLARKKEQLFEEGDKYYKAKQFDDAISVYEKIVQLDPQDVEAYAKKGDALRKLKRNKEALVAYDCVLAINASNAAIWNFKGEILYKLRRYGEALEAYNRASELDANDPVSWVSKGNILYKLRRYEEALEAYKHALAFDAKNVDVWTANGNILFKLGRYEEALLAFEEALKISPKKSAIWDAKGEALYYLTRYEDAWEAHNRALALDPYNNDIASKCDRLRDLIKHLREKSAREQVQKEPEFQKQEKFGTRVIDLDELSVPHAEAWQAPSAKRQKTDEPKNPSVEGTRILEPFDVFLTHSHLDAKWVEENLAGRLKDEHGFNVWLDKWNLIPGESYQQAWSIGLEQARCCAVCIGEQTAQGWFKQIIQKAKNRQVQDPSFRVIPVLLPTAKNVNLDEFLELNTIVDFREPDIEYAFYVLACGVKGIPPGRWSLNDTNSMRTTTLTEEMLLDLERLRQSNLISDPVREEYMRVTMKEVWFVEWTLKMKGDKNG